LGVRSLPAAGRAGEGFRGRFPAPLPNKEGSAAARGGSGLPSSAMEIAPTKGPKSPFGDWHRRKKGEARESGPAPHVIILTTPVSF
jgi:hypothetical protein